MKEGDVKMQLNFKILSCYFQNEKEGHGNNGENFHDRKFYVDKTCICYLSEHIIYVSKSAITPKCAQYVHAITAKAQSLGYLIINVPQWYSADTRSHEFYKVDILKAFAQTINSLKTQRDIYSRSHMKSLYSTLLVIDKECFKVPEELLSITKNALSEMEKALSVEDTELKRAISENSYYKLVQMCYFGECANLSLVNKLRNYLNPTGEYAFLRYDPVNEVTYSSETMCGAHKEVMTKEEAWACSSAIEDGSVKHGMKFGKYPIMKVCEGYVQIGCNKYNRELLHSFYLFMQDYM